MMRTPTDEDYRWAVDGMKKAAMDANRRFAELVGAEWFERVDPDGFCSCRSYHPAHLPDQCPTNPDFAADPRLVLREMSKRPDFPKFLVSMGTGGVRKASYTTEPDRYLVYVDYMTDTTGQLRDRAGEWLERAKTTKASG